MSSGEEALLEEIVKLREIAATAGDPKLSALLVAVSDERVQRSLLAKSQTYAFGGVGVSTTVDPIDVLFSFRRRNGEFGILPISTLARVSLRDGRVVHFSDNFPSGELTLHPGLGSLQPDLDLRSKILDSPVVQVARDIDGGTKTAPPPKESTWVMAV